MISFLKGFINKFRYAFAGLFHGLRYDRSILLQVIIGILVIVVCACISIDVIEWCIILVVIGLIIALEYINSAIEEIVDEISPQYSQMAKKVKDYTAAAVLVMSLFAAVIGFIIIGGHLLW